MKAPGRWTRLLFGGLFLAVATAAVGGGLFARTDTVVFKGGVNEFEPGAPVVMTFLADGYLYGAHRYAYGVLAVVPAATRGRLSSTELDSWPVFGILLSDADVEKDLARAASPLHLRFEAPERPGEYKVLLWAVPHFRDRRFERGADYKEAFVAQTGDRQVLLQAIRSGPTQEVARLRVSASRVARDQTPPVYVQLNGKLPAVARVEGGVQDKPLRFSWYVGREFNRPGGKLVYRYRLEPEDDWWGAWTTQKEVSYSFLVKGFKRFSVQARWSDGSTTLASAPAAVGFNLPKDYISQPTAETLLKAPFGAPPLTNTTLQFADVYGKSSALLVGLWEFDDTGHFAKFDAAKISADLDAMETALRRSGFEVTVLKAPRLTLSAINAALGRLVRAAGRDDRLFVYFSTHGFPDPMQPAEGYLATSDCRFSEPLGTCLRLSELETHAARALDGKDAKQVMFAVDSCFSGLGVVRKSSVDISDLNRLAAPKGVYMLTAGMANQLAQIDPTLNMSTFTHFLANGLHGEADIVKDGLITLSELFVFVQHKVAQQTKGAQIPMLGRMRGDGEMIFRVPR